MARLTNHESYQKQIEERITKTPCPLPHYPLHDGLLLDLRQYPKIASLKHSQPGLDFFEEAYLSTCPYQFAKVSLDNLENVLNYLKAELE
ncbi:exopolyphosphatase domain protein [Streptococcus pneumoniae GA04672]|nr:exopolyphosphatase domain protein [Streptococcus pneumoniae GA04672]CAG5927831.1 GntR family transcriptional regulator [Streptococcus pneumoniae]